MKISGICRSNANKILCMFFLAVASCSADSTRTNSMIYAGLGGNGIFGAGYEKRIADQWSADVGVSFLSPFYPEIAFPIRLNYQFGPASESHHAEFSGGITQGFWEEILVSSIFGQPPPLYAFTLATASIGYKFTFHKYYYWKIALIRFEPLSDKGELFHDKNFRYWAELKIGVPISAF